MGCQGEEGSCSCVRAGQGVGHRRQHCSGATPVGVRAAGYWFATALCVWHRPADPQLRHPRPTSGLGAVESHSLPNTIPSSSSPLDPPSSPVDRVVVAVGQHVFGRHVARGAAKGVRAVAVLQNLQHHVCGTSP